MVPSLPAPSSLRSSWVLVDLSQDLSQDLSLPHSRVPSLDLSLDLSPRDLSLTAGR